MTDNHAHVHFREMASASRRRLLLALVITAAFVVAEAIAGLLSNSLALLTDAAHNLTDVIALGLSWYAIRLAGRAADSRRTYGYHRAGILIALLNSTTLVVIALGIFYEAIRRLLNPLVVESEVLIGMGVVAFLVNAGTAWLVKRGSEHDLNMRSAFLHLVSDAISTLGAVIAGIAIRFTGWNVLDPAVSILIGALIVWNGWVIIRESVSILLESSPRSVDMSQLVSDLNDIQGVDGIHDLHVWSLSQEMRALSAHVLVGDMAISDGATIQRRINECLWHDYGIAHATLQLECSGCEPDRLYCDLNGAPAQPLPAQEAAQS